MVIKSTAENAKLTVIELFKKINQAKIIRSDLKMETTISKIQSIINERLQSENRDIEYHNKILAVLKSHNGKQITKRLATELQSIFTTDKVIYDTNYSMYHIEIWINGEYSNRIRFLIGYAGQNRFNNGGIIDADNFDNEFDCCSGKAATLRNDRRKALLNDAAKLQHIADTIDTLNTAIQDLEYIVNYSNIEDCYAIKKLVSKELKDHQK